MDNEPTRKGEELISAWRKALERVQRAEAELKKAESDLKSSAFSLGDWLTPRDARPGETFCVWFGDSLIAAEYQENGVEPYIVKIRKRGKSLV